MTGPLINEVVEPPEIAELAVLVTESKLVAEVAKKPEVSVRFPDTEVAALKVTVLLPGEPELAKVRLLNVVDEVPPIVCGALPLKLIVPDPAVNVPPLFVQLPDAVRLVFAVKVPAVNVAAPVIDIVAGAVKLPVVSV